MVERRARAVRHGLWLIGYVAAVHFAWAVLLVLSPDAQGATPVFGLHRVVSDRFLLAALLALSSVLVAWLLARDSSSLRLSTYLRLLPQQFLLMFSATESLRASVLQHYSDGVPRPWAFITADQLPSILIAAFHTAVLVKLGQEVILRDRRTA